MYYKRFSLSIVVAFLSMTADAQVDLRPGPEKAQQERSEQDHQALIDKWNEYAGGRRDHRDAYVILNRLLPYYPRWEAGIMDDGHEWKSQLSKVMREHPELAKNQPRQLIEEIDGGAYRKKIDAEFAAKTAKWVPADDDPVKVIGFGRNAAAVFQRKISFYELPSSTSLQAVPENDWRKLLHPLAPVKVLTFKHAFMFPYGAPSGVKTNFIICTDLIRDWYSPRTDDERKILAAKGFRNTAYPWVNAAGQIDQFCGILSLKGEPVFEFPIEQMEPAPLAEPVWITDDGTKAAIAVGEKRTEEGEDGPLTDVRPIKEVWIWTAPSNLRKISSSEAGGDNTLDLRDRFIKGKF